MQLLHECTNQHALKIDSSATKRKILQQHQVSYPSSCFAIHTWSQTLYKVVFESQFQSTAALAHRPSIAAIAQLP